MGAIRPVLLMPSKLNPDGVPIMSWSAMPRTTPPTTPRSNSVRSQARGVDLVAALDSVRGVTKVPTQWQLVFTVNAGLDQRWALVATGQASR